MWTMEVARRTPAPKQRRTEVRTALQPEEASRLAGTSFDLKMSGSRLRMTGIPPVRTMAMTLLQIRSMMTA